MQDVPWHRDEVWVLLGCSCRLCGAPSIGKQFPAFGRRCYPHNACSCWPITASQCTGIISSTDYLINLLTYLLAQWIRIFLFIATLKKFLAHYGPKWSSVFTTAHHWSYPKPDKSSSQSSILVRYNPVLSFRLHLGLPDGLFPSGFITKTCVHLSCLPPHVPHPPVRRVTSPSRLEYSNCTKQCCRCAVIQCRGCCGTGTAWSWTIRGSWPTSTGRSAARWPYRNCGMEILADTCARPRTEWGASRRLRGCLSLMTLRSWRRITSWSGG